MVSHSTSTSKLSLEFNISLSLSFLAFSPFPCVFRPGIFTISDHYKYQLLYIPISPQTKEKLSCYALLHGSPFPCPCYFGKLLFAIFYHASSHFAGSNWLPPCQNEALWKPWSDGFLYYLCSWPFGKFWSNLIQEGTFIWSKLQGSWSLTR